MSVVIPVFNGAAVLPAQLGALSRQTYRGGLEIVVADNGSTDDTARIARTFGGESLDVRVVDASAVRGPSHARNVGAAAAKGDPLLFCDADDVVDPDWVAAMVRALPGGDLLAGVGVETSDPERQVLGKVKPPAVGSFRFLPWHRSSNLAVRREVLEGVGGFDESRTIGEDVDLCWRVQVAGYRFVFVEDAKVAYRERDTLAQALARQFRFGRAAPELYRDFAASGAPSPDLRWLLGGVFGLLRSSPRVLTGRTSRRRWLSTAAGVAGRGVGLLQAWMARRRLA